MLSANFLAGRHGPALGSFMLSPRPPLAADLAVGEHRQGQPQSTKAMVALISYGCIIEIGSALVRRHCRSAHLSYLNYEAFGHTRARVAHTTDHVHLAACLACSHSEMRLIAPPRYGEPKQHKPCRPDLPALWAAHRPRKAGTLLALFRHYFITSSPAATMPSHVATARS
jgi:hypothetical protein